MEMKTSGSARGFISRVLPPDKEVRGLVQIGFLLKDTLNVIIEVDEEEEETSVIMSQRCYEQTIISMDSSDVDDMDYVKEAVSEALLEMHKNLHAEDSESPEVESIIQQLVHSTRQANPSFGTLSLEIRIDSVTDKPSDDGLAAPTGEHGFVRLLQCCFEKCAICLHGFNVPKDVIVTTCHHAFHKTCILPWLQNRSHSCPVCRFNLAPITGRGHIQFD